MTEHHEERNEDDCFQYAERITYTNLLNRVAPYLQNSGDDDD